MRKLVLRDELVIDPERAGAYFKVNVRVKDSLSLEGETTIEGRGRVKVYKNLHKYPIEHTDFAWSIREEK